MTIQGIIVLILIGLALVLWLLDLVRRDRLYVGYGVVFILARLSHAIGIGRPGPHPLRGIGAGGTWLVIVALAVWALAIGYQTEWTPPAVKTIPAGQPAA